MRFKLRDIYDTRYFYKTFCVDLTYMFDNILALRKDSSLTPHAVNAQQQKVFDAAKAGTFIEFDLADCKITPDCVNNIMYGIANGIDFCDSQDLVRDSILQENKRRIQSRPVAIDLPEFTVGSSVKAYIKELDSSLVYRIPVTGDPKLWYPLVYIIQVCRPSIRIMCGNHEHDFMLFVGRHLTVSDLNAYSEFYYVTNEGVYLVAATPDRKVNTQKLGLVSIQESLTVGALVPSVFGKEKLLHTQGFDLLFDQCLRSMQSIGTGKKVTLRELFTQEAAK